MSNHYTQLHSDDRSRTSMRIAQRAVKLIDVLLMALIFDKIWFIFYADTLSSPFYRRGNFVVIALFMVIYYFFAHLYNGYALHICRITELIYSQALAAFIADCIMYIVIWLLARHLPAVLPMLLLFALELGVISIWAFLAHKWYFRTFPRKKTVVVWETRRGFTKLANAYGLNKHFEIIGKPAAKECVREKMKALEDAEVVFLYGVHTSERNKIIKYCIAKSIDVYVIPRVGDIIMSAARPMPLFHLPTFFLERYNPTPEYLFMKRLTDIVLCTIALIVLSPIMIITAIIIKATDGGTVFYRQTRLTKDGRTFNVLKFRSMRMDAEKDGVARLSTGEKDDRIT